MLITKREKELLNAIAFIQYGELYDVDIPIEKPDCDLDGIGPDKVWLIHYLRDNGLVDLVKINQGNVSQIEVKGKYRGISYTQKICFATF